MMLMESHSVINLLVLQRVGGGEEGFNIMNIYHVVQEYNGRFYRFPAFPVVVVVVVVFVFFVQSAEG